jgi:lipid-A-disaccharide synthase
VPVLYYIAPQLWAWGAHRIHRLRDRADRVAVILPFEEPYLRGGGVDARFVGHPLAETVDGAPLDGGAVAELRRAGRPFVALLPGSRQHVVREVLPGQLAVARAIGAKLPGAAFGISVASPSTESIILDHLRCGPASIRAYPNRHRELIEAADLVLVASGTTTLEVAFRRRPMIVMYNASPLFYHLVARWMIRSPRLSLPNILAGREIVPEFMPYYATTEPIARRAIELLQSPDARAAMVEQLDAVVAPLRGARASDNTAAMLLEMIASRRH